MTKNKLDHWKASMGRKNPVDIFVNLIHHGNHTDFVILEASILPFYQAFTNVEQFQSSLKSGINYDCDNDY